MHFGSEMAAKRSEKGAKLELQGRWEEAKGQKKGMQKCKARQPGQKQVPCGPRGGQGLPVPVLRRAAVRCAAIIKPSELRPPQVHENKGPHPPPGYPL